MTTATTSKNDNDFSKRGLIRNKKYIQWSLAIQLMRAPSLMTSLAFVIIGYYVTGGHTIGGLMVTAYTICLTFFAVPGGRLVDKMGVTKGLLFLLIGSSVTFICLTIATSLKLPSVYLIVLAGISGAFLAGAPGGFRTLLSRIIHKKLIPSAIAIDATVIEVVVVTAPLVVAFVATLWEPGAALTMVVASLLSAILAYSLASDSEENKLENESNVTESFAAPKRLWLNPRYIFWVLVSIAFGHALGTAETGAFPIAQSFGWSANTAALLIGIVAVFSIISGLIYAAFENKLRFSKFSQACIMLAALVLGCAGLYISESWVVLIPSLIVIGTFTAPLMIVRSQAVEDEIPIDRKSEGFSLITAAHSIGFGLSGVFLASFTLKGMLIAGAVSGIVVLVLTPVLLSKRLYEKAKLSKIKEDGVLSKTVE